MKKFVLVMICALLMVIFIAFNYLLWDRENKEKDIQTLETSNASNDASITALGREIKLLEDENRTLKTRLDDLDKTYKTLLASKNQLEQGKVKDSQLMEHQNAIIDSLKRNVDIKLLEAPVKKWIEAVDAGDYDKAYTFQNKSFNDKMGFTSNFDFAAAFRSEVKNIKFKSVKLVVDGLPEEMKHAFVLSVIVEVKTTPYEGKARLGLSEGSNERIFTLDYDSILNDWTIQDISLKP